jgi:hypothetical protein
MGIKVWKNARDATGFTPEDYARKRGFLSYIQMVQEKIGMKIPRAHVSVAIELQSMCPAALISPSDKQLFVE